MANLGNVWHIPANPEPHGRPGMRDPVFPTAPTTSVTVTTGNQFAGGGNQGNQLEIGSSIFYRHSSDAAWAEAPLRFTTGIGNNKYYSAVIPTDTLAVGDVIQYYFRIAYDDHDTTFVLSNADGRASTTAADEGPARDNPFTVAIDSAATRGQWGSIFTLPNVAVHASVLPTGSVLLWGRRDSPDQSLDVDPPSPLQPDTPPAPPATCTPFVWNPSTGEVTDTPQPTLAGPEGTRANLFCSGHAFLPDGRLFVAGGHLSDGVGLKQTTVYDAATNTWIPDAAMTDGRWYPTVTTLPDGSLLVLSGSYFDPALPGVRNNLVPELWANGTLTPLAGPGSAFDAFDLYPRTHVGKNGLVHLTGPKQQTWSFDVSAGQWTQGPARSRAGLDYAPSVLYDVDKVIYIGGGNPPATEAEVLDLSSASPQWRPTAAMHFPRRQHNATLLADGTVLVTGGTRGGGTDQPQNFNNLDPGQPVHVAELWDPGTGEWSELAAEEVDRCYHSTAVLLPDATVLSAGGGEFFPVEGIKRENDPLDTHRDAQIFSPPYLFKGPRPEISSTPDTVSYGETFLVTSPEATEISKVTWVALSSVTHSFNTGQRLNVLTFQATAEGLQVHAPGSANECPPGHYMLFLIGTNGVPSVAKILRISAAAAPTALATGPAAPLRLQRRPPQGGGPADAVALREAVRRMATGTRVVLGIAGSCPYGIAACWGAANEALHALDAVRYVDPIPDGETSTATVFLVDERLPALDRWREQFHDVVHDSYRLRGVEVTVGGTIEEHDGHLVLRGDGARPPVHLIPLDPSAKVQWDAARQGPRPALPEEMAAYGTLREAIAVSPGRVVVTGPLIERGSDYQIQVRVVAEA